jgi:DUF2075 family protein
MRSFYSKNLIEFLKKSPLEILREISLNNKFDLTPEQKDAWKSEIALLQSKLSELTSGHVIFEYTIPRVNKRVDVILLYSGIVFVLEFKVGPKKYSKADEDQCVDYALDLKDFHEESHNVSIIPILVVPEASSQKPMTYKSEDGVFKLILSNGENLKQIISYMSEHYSSTEIMSDTWENSQYRPTPTIIESAQVLFDNNDVEAILSNDAGKINLNNTAKTVNGIIDKSKKEHLKSICFITGVPGAGKTLAGLFVAHKRQDYKNEEHTIFLSGNGPLIKVLQESLARNASKKRPPIIFPNCEDCNPEQKDGTRKILKIPSMSIGSARRLSSTFIKNIHTFRDDMADRLTSPTEKVIIFDEAQRAWDEKETSKIMKNNHNIDQFGKSEPEFLLDVMNRHEDWSVVICLVGGGQEINRGEAGMQEWLTTLKGNFKEWNVYLSDKITDSEYVGENKLETLLDGIRYEIFKDLHLDIPLRSFRNKDLPILIKNILDGEIENAKKILPSVIKNYPIMITRNIDDAKQWLKDTSRGNQRFGLIASSKAQRLRAFGIFVDFLQNTKNAEVHWFLENKEDIRSSFSLELVAREYDIQGLELDWTCVAWDADLRWEDDQWRHYKFSGTKWQKIDIEQNQLYLKNAYRVLLTRARQGMIIFVPEGDLQDETRKNDFYDKTYNLLKEIGIPEI